MIFFGPWRKLPGMAPNGAGPGKLVKGPKPVNRAHGTTKENTQNPNNFCIFPAHGENGLKWHAMGPGGFLFLLILSDTLGDVRPPVRLPVRPPPAPRPAVREDFWKSTNPEIWSLEI